MSVLTVTFLTAALLGAEPQLAISGNTDACAVESNGSCQANGSHCQSGGHGWCPWCCDSDGDDCEPCCWDRHLLNYCVGPGDFHPHYPYPPVYHGYYYFRPYNHEHVWQASELALQMGGDPKAPYAVDFLKQYFAPAPIEQLILPVGSELPLLEDLLQRKAAIE